MGRPRMLPGTHGEVKPRSDGAGGYRARIYYRDAMGKRREINVEGPSKGAVKRAFQKRWKQISEDMVLRRNAAENVTVEQLFNQWVDYEQLKIRAATDKAQRPHIEQVTLRTYCGQIRTHVLPRIGELPVRELTVGVLNRLFLDIYHETTASTAEKVRAVLSRLCRYAVDQEMLHTNLVRDTDPEAIRYRTPQPEALSTDDLSAARQAARRWCAASASRKLPLVGIMDVMLGTGCRISEALALHWDDIHLADQRPWIYNHMAVKWRTGTGLVRSSTKTRKKTRVVIPQFTINSLLGLRVESQSPIVFPNRSGAYTHPNYVREKFGEAMRDAGVEAFSQDGGFKTHLFRKTALTAIERTIGLQAAADQAGHSSVLTTTRSYIAEDTRPIDNTSALDSLIGDFTDILETHPGDTD